MNSEKVQVVRVSPMTVIIFSMLFSPALIMGGLLVMRGEQMKEAIGLLVFYLGAVYWICSPTVELMGNRLIYRALFKRKEIGLDEVGLVGMSVRPAPMLGLWNKGGAKELISFAVKPFSKVGIATILQHICEYCPEVKLDRFAQDMAMGDATSISKETRSARNLIRLFRVIGSSALGGALVKLFLMK